MKFCIGAALAAAPVYSQEPPPADPDERQPQIEVPDLVAADGKYGNELKFFVFHKVGTSFADARREIAECSSHLARGKQLKMPAFLAWEDSDRTAEQVEFNGSYGLVGLAFYSILEGPLDRSIRQQVMMRCMLPRGFDRYSVTEPMWKQIHEGDNPSELINLQAAIASGPVPSTPKVTS
ncbi:hypothetical protein GRI43_07695 [Altererythrobacter luteolus]|uniref:Uncharacterized protein n=1 Tax=Pontixanthobacter luteolus TaxID=295089 RepID=A0A6I4V032_9SPHN|nr:hypothetical protein [Pontixanthobacter luteolus]MXP47273.1 hypothetical protein [Pontixanthobacter luteolus]